MSSILKKPEQTDSSKLNTDEEKNNTLENNNSLKDPSVPKIWYPSEKEILIKWAEIASCYRYLHELSFRFYQHNNYCYTIPVIVVSNLSGSISL